MQRDKRTQTYVLTDAVHYGCVEVPGKSEGENNKDACHKSETQIGCVVIDS